IRAVGSSNRHVDNNGEPDEDSSLPRHRVAVARRTGFIGRGGGRGGGRSKKIFPSLSVSRLPPDYHLGAHERSVWAIVFRGHTRRRGHFQGHTDCAFFGDTRL